MNNEPFRPAWVEIDLNIISQNVDIIKSRLAGPDVEICGVVKANAYGHGQAEVTKLLKSKGVKNFAVATLKEAQLARELTPEDRVIVLGLVRPDDFEFALENKLTLNISNLDHAKQLSDYAVSRGEKAEVFAAVDTGMGRIGFLSEDADTVENIKEISQLPGLNMLGIMSHFSGSNDLSPEGIAYTDMQEKRFADLREKLLAAGVPLPICTLANSFATMDRPSTHYQMVRPGATLYGSYVDTLKPRFGIQAALSVKALIMHIKEVSAGSCIGYNRETVLTRKSRVATLNIGYADGFPRTWANRTGYVLIHGKKAPVSGVVCMDQFMIDITDIPEAQLYDVATLIGRDGDLEITADEIGAATGSIFDTICVDMSLRLPYKYIR